MTDQSAMLAILKANREYVRVHGHNPPFPGGEVTEVSGKRGKRKRDKIITDRMLACWTIEQAIRDLGLGFVFRSWLRRQGFAAPNTLQRNLGAKAEFETLLRLFRHLLSIGYVESHPAKSDSAKVASKRMIRDLIPSRENGLFEPEYSKEAAQ